MLYEIPRGAHPLVLRLDKRVRLCAHIKFTNTYYIYLSYTIILTVLFRDILQKELLLYQSFYSSFGFKASHIFFFYTKPISILGSRFWRLNLVKIFSAHFNTRSFFLSFFLTDSELFEPHDFLCIIVHGQTIRLMLGRFMCASGDFKHNTYGYYYTLGTLSSRFSWTAHYKIFISLTYIFYSWVLLTVQHFIVCNTAGRTAVL